MKNVRVFQYDGREVVEVPMAKLPLIEAENVQILDFGGRSSQTEPIDPRARKPRPIDSILGPSERGAAPLPLPILDGYEPKRSLPR